MSDMAAQNLLGDDFFGIERPALPLVTPEPQVMDTLEEMSTPPSEPHEANPLNALVTPPVQLWNPSLSFEVAMGLDDLETILGSHGITRDQYDHILQHTAYRRELAAHQKDLRENGASYKSKARVMAEEYLLDIHSIVKSPLATQSTKLDAIKYVTKVAELEPTKDSGTGNAGNTVNIQINI